MQVIQQSPGLLTQAVRAYASMYGVPSNVGTQSSSSTMQNSAMQPDMNSQNMMQGATISSNDMFKNKLQPTGLMTGTVNNAGYQSMPYSQTTNNYGG